MIRVTLLPYVILYSRLMKFKQTNKNATSSIQKGYAVQIFSFGSNDKKSRLVVTYVHQLKWLYKHLIGLTSKVSLTPRFSTMKFILLAAFLACVSGKSLLVSDEVDLFLIRFCDSFFFSFVVTPILHNILYEHSCPCSCLYMSTV
jgi:hypothetical protein